MADRQMLLELDLFKEKLALIGKTCQPCGTECPVKSNSRDISTFINGDNQFKAIDGSLSLRMIAPGIVGVELARQKMKHITSLNCSSTS